MRLSAFPIIWVRSAACSPMFRRLQAGRCRLRFSAGCRRSRRRFSASTTPGIPGRVAVAQVPFGKAVSANSLIEPGSIQKNCFLCRRPRPVGHADILDINHKALAVDGSVGGFGFCLSARDAAQADERVRRLDLVSPHLCRALDASLFLGSHADGKRQLSVVLELMPNAALLLDGRGRVTQANAAAEQLLRQSDGIAFDCRRQPPTGVRARQRVSRAGAGLEGCDRGCRRAGRVAFAARAHQPASGAAPLLVVAVPLPRPSFPIWELVASASALVVIVDPLRNRAPRLYRYRQLMASPRRKRASRCCWPAAVTGSQMPGCSVSPRRRSRPICGAVLKRPARIRRPNCRACSRCFRQPVWATASAAHRRTRPARMSRSDL